MPALAYGRTDDKRNRGNLPELPVVNMFVEESGSEGVVLQSRPPLVDRGADMGSGPVQALFKRDGVVSGALLGVSGGTLYRGSTAVGGIAGNGVPSIAGNELGAMIAAGSTLYHYNTSLAAVSFPDSTPVIKIVEGASRFIALTARRFYFTPSLGLTFDPLDFATPESESDQLRDGLFIDDALILFGAETVEVWPNTGDSLTPFVPLQGRVFERGIKATGCATALGSTFAWITDQSTVCIGDENNIVSTPGLQERIRAASDCRAFNFFIDGVEFLAVRFDGETQAYNLRTGTWSEFSTFGANWRAQCHADGVFGSATDGKTLAFGEGHEELGGVLERRFRAGLPINGGGIPINNLRLRTNPGQTPFLTGDYAPGEVEMRLSDDAGQTWGPWEPESLGAQGDYGKRVEWRGLGLASPPGFFPEFRMTDPIPFRVTGVFVNEPWGGR